MLFKAKRAAEAEFEAVAKDKGVTTEKLKKKIRGKRAQGTHYSKHVVAGTAANMLCEVA